MILQEYLENAPQERFMYIGSGAGFLVAGYKEKPFDHNETVYMPLLDQIEDVDAELLEKYNREQKKRENRYLKYFEKYGEDNLITQGAKIAVDTSEPPIPLLKRKVIQEWLRYEEDAMNVQIEGKEVGEIWSVYESDTINISYNEELLVGAVFRDVVKNYKSVFALELSELKSILDRLTSYIDQSRGYERYIRYLCGMESYKDSNGREHEFPNKLFGVASPEVIINIARSEVSEMLQLKAEERGKKKKKNETP